jgi:hypothetical protein
MATLRNKIFNQGAVEDDAPMNIVEFEKTGIIKELIMRPEKAGVTFLKLEVNEDQMTKIYNVEVYEGEDFSWAKKLADIFSIKLSANPKALINFKGCKEMRHRVNSEDNFLIWEEVLCIYDLPKSQGYKCAIELIIEDIE